MDKCLNCEKFNALADENEELLNRYNLLKIRYDMYDNICFDYGILGFVLGIIITLLIIWLI